MAPERPAASYAVVERRLVGRALAHWDSLRGERRLPSRSQFFDGPIGDDHPNAFVIEVGAHEHDDRIVHAGRALIEALGADPTGQRVIEVLPSATERGLSFCRVAVDLMKPIADVGRFVNRNGSDVFYRSVLLPLSDDQTRVNYVLGAFSYKLAA
jgi:hypothetical protein